MTEKKRVSNTGLFDIKMKEVHNEKQKRTIMELKYLDIRENNDKGNGIRRTGGRVWTS